MPLTWGSYVKWWIEGNIQKHIIEPYIYAIEMSFHGI
jgi:hypothetical protein